MVYTRALGANTVEQARQGGTWTVVPRRCRASASTPRRAEMGADETIGDGEVEVVATVTGSGRTMREHARACLNTHGGPMTQSKSELVGLRLWRSRHGDVVDVCVVVTPEAQEELGESLVRLNGTKTK
jgi:hypothetical protein